MNEKLKAERKNNMIFSPEEFIRRVQKNLRRIRTILNFSAAEFANYLGITRQTVNNLETEKTTLGYVQMIAVLAVIEHKIKKVSPEWYWIQELLDIYPAECGTDSFLELWFQINESQKTEYDADSKLSFLYENLIKDSPPVLTVNRLVERNDKIYLFYDFLLKKECFVFFDKFTECILKRQKCLPLVVFKTHLQALIARKAPETELQVLKVYEKMNHLKEREILIIEDSGCAKADFLREYHIIYQETQRKNLFVTVLTENRQLLEIAEKNCHIYGIDDFSDIAVGGI